MLGCWDSGMLGCPDALLAFLARHILCPLALEKQWPESRDGEGGAASLRSRVGVREQMEH